MISQQTPQELTRMAAGQVEADVGGPFTDAAPDLDQAQAEGIELHMRMATGGEPAAQRVEEPVDGCMQDEAELIGPEAMIAQAVGEAGPLDILDPQFGGAARAVEGVEGLWLIAARGDDKAGVGAFGQHLRLV